MEIDHIPARALFDQRQWPEGYEFPACEPCNRISRHDEHVVAMLSRLYPEADNENKKREFSERVRAVAHNYPGLLEEMSVSTDQAQDTLKKYNIQTPEGLALSDLPFLSVKGPLVCSAVASFGRKLFLALYYKHTNKILPREGGIAILWYSNLQVENGEIPVELAPLVSGFPILERSRTDISEQFFYRFGVTDNLKASVFLAFFRQSFAILGYVNAKAVGIQLTENATILQPYQHKT